MLNKFETKAFQVQIFSWLLPESILLSQILTQFPLNL